MAKLSQLQYLFERPAQQTGIEAKQCLPNAVHFLTQLEDHALGQRINVLMSQTRPFLTILKVDPKIECCCVVPQKMER
jgi:hypothetical protein